MNPDNLRNIAVLQAVEGDALARLAAALEEKVLADGQTVFSEGDRPDAMYFIQEGFIRIEKRAQAAGSANKTLSILEAGDYFGEMALFEDKPRSASALASGPATILRLSKSAFDELHKKSAAAGLNVLSAMIRTSSERIRRLSTEVVVYDEIGKAIGESRDLQALSDVILQQLTTATQADASMILISAQFSDRLDIRSSVNLSLSPAQREEIGASRGFLGIVRQHPKDLLVHDFDMEEAFKSAPRLGFEQKSLIVATILVAGQFLGLFVLTGREPGQFTPNHLNLARGIARQTGQAILNARHREEEQARSRHARQFVRF